MSYPKRGQRPTCTYAGRLHLGFQYVLVWPGKQSPGRDQNMKETATNSREPLEEDSEVDSEKASGRMDGREPKKNRLRLRHDFGGAVGPERDELLGALRPEPRAESQMVQRLEGIKECLFGMLVGPRRLGRLESLRLGTLWGRVRCVATKRVLLWFAKQPGGHGCRMGGMAGGRFDCEQKFECAQGEQAETPTGRVLGTG